MGDISRLRLHGARSFKPAENEGVNKKELDVLDGLSSINTGTKSDSDPQKSNQERPILVLKKK
ncbi:MAG: hypothetical protein KKE17_11355 [Proteobacteria bacterium]|nr:hypothetical protein [Pseudomonadota bacterium]MBU1710591.1 hypothetical protein [Pseudomonadota bacterium]